MDDRVTVSKRSAWNTTQPPEGKPVEVLHGVDTRLAYYQAGKWHDAYTDAVLVDVTHWRPVWTSGI